MIIPAMTAALWTRTLTSRLILSCLLGAAGSILGILGAIYLDTSLAGMMAAILGILFIISLIIAPSTGLLASFQRKKNQQFAFGRETLLQHLLFHYNTDLMTRENAIDTLPIHMKWSKTFTNKICESLIKDGYVIKQGNLLLPTKQGKLHNQFYRENLHS